MRTLAVSSSTFGQCAPPRRSCRVVLPRRETSLPPTKCCGLPRLSCSAKRKSAAIRVGRVSVGFGAVEWRGLRLGSVRAVAARAQEKEKEQLEIEKVEEKSPESWTSSVRRANMVSRIFMATFVWISLFFGISVTNNEASGGRPGRRGPRK